MSVAAAVGEVVDAAVVVFVAVGGATDVVDATVSAPFEVGVDDEGGAAFVGVVA